MRYTASVFFMCFNGNLFSPTAQTLKEIYKNGVFSLNRFGPIRWMKYTKGYSGIEKSNNLKEGIIVRDDTLSVGILILIFAEVFIRFWKNKPLTVADYNWTENYNKQFSVMSHLMLSYGVNELEIT
ncbi:hypothetical protein CLV48_11236 [Cecembia rubra]|uniref:Uncharacterized protein n=2 Tax=Cecembia rubra TaxID=1485585 RepID=A0A2P8DWV3_9BACT|nr:hypothetical protein CLV48_11236 [Cecembia rubra]